MRPSDLDEAQRLIAFRAAIETNLNAKMPLVYRLHVHRQQTEIQDEITRFHAEGGERASMIYDQAYINIDAPPEMVRPLLEAEHARVTARLKQLGVEIV